MKTLCKPLELVELLKHHGKTVSEKDATLMLGYYEGHACDIRTDNENRIYFAYSDENDCEALEELPHHVILHVADWNTELIEDAIEEGDPVELEKYKSDEVIIDRLYEYLY